MTLGSGIESTAITDIAFWLISVSVIVAAMAVVLIKDLFRAALFLALALLGVAGMFILLRAEVLAVGQVLIYVGAISVLILFAIMMTRDVSEGNPSNRLRIPASILGLILFGVFTFVIVQVDWKIQSVPDSKLDRYQSDPINIITKFSYFHICFWLYCDPKHSGAEFAVNSNVENDSPAGIETQDTDQDSLSLDEVFVDTIPSIAKLLLRDFVLAFEAASVLLLAAIIGALSLLRER